MSLTWSKYQEDLFIATMELATKPSGAIGVKAMAGAAKTTSIVEIANRLPREQTACFVAFNKHIAEELQRRVPENVTACTLNSFGWRACRQAFRGVKLDDWKTQNIVDLVLPDRKEQKAWGGAIKRLISLKKACPDLTAEEILKKYDIEAPTDPRFMVAAGDVWQRAVRMTGIMDFDDQIFMVIHKKLQVDTYDWVIVDEAQDLSQVQIKLIKLIAPRILFVGDPNQGIYGFRGADPDAFEQITASTDARVLPLSICYRCPRLVVEEAQKIVPAIEVSPNAKDGTVDTIEASELRVQAKPLDWVLCRTTAPLVKECLKFIVAGIKSCVRGRDIGKQIASLIDKVAASNAVLIEDFSTALTSYAAGEYSRLEAAGRDAQLQALEDRVESIHALAEGARTVGDLKARIDTVFSDEKSPGVTFATVHRSKGLEEKNIFILRPDLMPFPKAKLEWQVKQEMNLKYVAITRAKERLTWVKKAPGDK